MKLRNASTINPVSAVVLDEMERVAPVLADAEFYTRPGSSTLVKESNEPGTEDVFRALNEDETSTGATRTETPVAKKIVSFEAKVDRVLEQRGELVESELETETRLKAQNAGYAVQEAIFEADPAVNAKQFTGMRKLVKAGKIYVPGAALPLELGGDAKRTGQQAFFEEVLNFFGRVPGGASHAYVNALLHTRMLIVAKQLGYYRQSKDELGNTIDVIGDTVIRSAGRKYDGSALLPFNETVSGTTTCSSIFAARWGEGTNLSILTTVGVAADYEGLRGKFHVNTADLDMALVLQNPAALHQMRRITLPAA